MNFIPDTTKTDAHKIAGGEIGTLETDALSVVMAKRLQKQQVKLADRSIVTRTERVGNKPKKLDIQRRDTFNADKTILDQEKGFGVSLAKVRKNRVVNRGTMAEWLGCNENQYGRFERRATAISLGMLIRLCELLDCKPVDILSEAAPQIWGKTKEIASVSIELEHTINLMSHQEREALLMHLKTRSITK